MGARTINLEVVGIEMVCETMGLDEITQTVNS